MGVWRQWVFPILRILVFAAIAAALVKIAFFSSPEESAGPEVPSGEVTAPEVLATVGSVYNTVPVSGTVSPVPAVKITSTAMGEIQRILIPTGTPVNAGDKLMEVSREEFREDGTSYRAWAVVEAPAAGTLRLTALPGQTISIGDDLGTVEIPQFRVTGIVQPDQLYRLLELPESAEVTISNGPAPFACTGLSLVSTEGGTELHCLVPTDVRVFAGLSAQLAVPAGEAVDVIVLPTTAVEGSAGTGNVWVVLPDGGTEIRPVVLGLTDGVMVQIVEGLAEGEAVLLYVPGADAVDPGMPIDPGFPIEEPGIIEECTISEDGSESCVMVER